MHDTNEKSRQVRANACICVVTWEVGRLLSARLERTNAQEAFQQATADADLEFTDDEQDGEAGTYASWGTQSEILSTEH